MRQSINRQGEESNMMHLTRIKSNASDMTHITQVQDDIMHSKVTKQATTSISTRTSRTTNNNHRSSEYINNAT